MVLPSGQYQRAREWVKVQLSATDEAKHAADVVRWWKRQRSAARHIARAIALYYALMQQDTTLLTEYFPFLTIGGLNNIPHQRKQPVAADLVEVTLVAKDEAADIDDFLDLM